MAFKHKTLSVKAGRKNLLPIIMSVVCFFAATAVLPFVFESGSFPPPNLLLCLALCIPAFAEKKAACVYALCLGFLNDLFVCKPTDLSPIVFLLGTCIVFYCQRHFARIGSLVIAVCSLPGIVVSAVVITFSAMMSFEGATSFGVLMRISLPYAACCFAASIVVASIMRFFSKRA